MGNKTFNWFGYHYYFALPLSPHPILFFSCVTFRTCINSNFDSLKWLWKKLTYTQWIICVRKVETTTHSAPVRAETTVLDICVCIGYSYSNVF